MKMKIGFIGLGLIGGSLAKAIRQYYPDCEITAFDKNKETLALATLESVIDVAATSLDDNFYGCRYLFLCAPVSCNTAYLKQLAVKGEALALHSLNPKYEDIVISPELPLRVLGKVISK